MRKILLFGLTLTALSVGAQQNNGSVLLNSSKPAKPMASIGKKDVGNTIIQQKISSNQKTRSNEKGWMSLQDAVFQSGVSASVYPPIYNDSTVRINPTTGTPFNWWVHGLGTSFSPTCPLYYAPPNSTYDNVFQVAPTNAYKIDSINIVGFYNRKTYNNYVDTLYIELTTNGTSTGGATTLQSGPDVWYSTNLLLSDSTFRWIASEYDYQANRISSSVTGKVVITKILDAAAYADTTADGIHDWKFAVPSFNVAAGAGVGALVTYKSGHNYAFNTDIDSVNYWQHLTEEMNGNATFPTVMSKDRSSGILMTSGDRYRLLNSSGGNDYVLVSGKQYTNPTYWYTAGLTYEDPYFSFFVNCPTCNPVSTKDVTTGINVTMSPNPATQYANLEITLTESAKNVNVTLMNTIGQVAKSINLGNVNANNTQNFNVKVSDLSKGMYIYTVTANGKKTSGKLMVN